MAVVGSHQRQGILGNAVQHIGQVEGGGELQAGSLQRPQLRHALLCFPEQPGVLESSSRVLGYVIKQGPYGGEQDKERFDP